LGPPSFNCEPNSQDQNRRPQPEGRENKKLRLEALSSSCRSDRVIGAQAHVSQLVTPSVLFSLLLSTQTSRLPTLSRRSPEKEGGRETDYPRETEKLFIKIFITLKN